MNALISLLHIVLKSDFSKKKNKEKSRIETSVQTQVHVAYIIIQELLRITHKHDYHNINFQRDFFFFDGNFQRDLPNLYVRILEGCKQIIVYFSYSAIYNNLANRELLTCLATKSKLYVHKVTLVFKSALPKYNDGVIMYGPQENEDKEIRLRGATGSKGYGT